MGQWNKNWQSIDFFFQLFIEIIFPFTSHYLKAPVPVVNNPIRSKIPWPTGDWQTGCLWWDSRVTISYVIYVHDRAVGVANLGVMLLWWWEAVESWFHLDLKSFFALKHNSRVFLLGHITRWINVIYESRVKWTWHHSQVRFSWGKFPPQTQSGTSSTIICTRWSSRYEGLGCHAPMVTTEWDRHERERD